MELVVVTGMSGAGKTQAIRCLEDLDYYCIDNIPPTLMLEFVNVIKRGGEEMERLAFVMDARGAKFFGDMRNVLEELRQMEDVNLRLIFLEASDAVLLNRYKETRRMHPLAQDGRIQDGIAKERELLSFAKEQASIVIDTTNLKTAALNAAIRKFIASERKKDIFSFTVMSFGFKNGIPEEADWVLDTRFIPNPFYVQSLKHLTGLNKKVQDYVMRFPKTMEFVDAQARWLLDLAPAYMHEGKYHLMIAVGCIRGQHPSVVVAAQIGQALDASDYNVILLHRELRNKPNNKNAGSYPGIL